MATKTNQYTIPAVTSTTNISYGQNGDQVKQLQALLNSQGANISTDGSFGAETYGALKAAQKKLGINVDGIYGTQTYGTFLKALQGATSPSGTNTNNISQQQVAGQPTTTGFNYDYSKDPLYQEQAKLTQSQISEEMAARGILNSTIDQERTAQALAGLGLDYKTQALNQYNSQQDINFKNQQYADQQKQQNIDNAWNRTEMTGYVSNADAALLGVRAGTRTANAIAAAKSNAPAAAKTYALGTSPAYKAIASPFINNFKESMTDEDATYYVQNLLRQVMSGTLTQVEFNLIVANSPITAAGTNIADILRKIQQGGTTTETPKIRDIYARTE